MWAGHLAAHQSTRNPLRCCPRPTPAPHIYSKIAYMNLSLPAAPERAPPGLGDAEHAHVANALRIKQPPWPHHSVHPAAQEMRPSRWKPALHTRDSGIHTHQALPSHLIPDRATLGPCKIIHGRIVMCRSRYKLWNYEWPPSLCSSRGPSDS